MLELQNRKSTYSFTLRTQFLQMYVSLHGIQFGWRATGAHCQRLDGHMQNFNFRIILQVLRSDLDVRCLPQNLGLGGDFRSNSHPECVGRIIRQIGLWVANPSHSDFTLRNQLLQCSQNPSHANIRTPNYKTEQNLFWTPWFIFTQL